MEEGGVGIQDVGEVRKVLHLKLAWRILSIDNLWSQFYKAKYIEQGHLVNTKSMPTESSLWKAILKLVLEVYENSCIKLKKETFLPILLNGFI